MDELSQKALQAKGNETLTNRLIQENKSFIKACAYASMHHYITENDDAYSIALLGFLEAIDKYEATLGSFSSFASLVIKRRLIDYLKSQAKYNKEISIEPIRMDGEIEKGQDPSSISMEIREKTAKAYEENNTSVFKAKIEIEEMQKILGTYGFSFFDLTTCSPKANKTKKSCAIAVKTLLLTPELFASMRQTKTLPMKELQENSQVPRKILERHRKYIIAASEIIAGEFPTLYAYLGAIRKEMETR